MSVMNFNHPSQGIRGMMSGMFGNAEESSTPSSAARLLKQDSAIDESSFSGLFNKRPSGEIRVARNLSSRMDLASSKKQTSSHSPLNRDGSFTIGAIHSSSSRSLLRYGSRQGSNSLPTSSSGLHKSSNSEPISKQLTQDRVIIDKKDAPELAALDRELKKMFKLQLGPLTLQSDIKPVLSMWDKLSRARDAYGRKAISITWLQLAHATAIVARKMTLSDINRVIHVQNCLVFPCPSGLSLPAGMLVALADRARTQLIMCNEEDFLQYCSSVGRLLRVLMGHEDGLHHPSTLQQGLKAFARASNAIPLAQAALVELVRRGKATAATNVRRMGDEQCRSNISTTLLIASALGELSGTPLAAPGLCLGRAAAAASAEAEDVMKQSRSVPWYQKMTAIPCIKSNIQTQAIKKKASVSIPTHISGCASESLRLAGEAAEGLARCLVPATVSLMTSNQLIRLSAALSNATDGDEGQPAAEPLRQSLGYVLAEVAKRATADDDALTRKCVKQVIESSRATLLHVQFNLVAVEGGVAAALASLQSWKFRDQHHGLNRCNNPHSRLGQLKKAFESEKEAHSLEMKKQDDDDEEEGEEAISRRPIFDLM